MILPERVTLTELYTPGRRLAMSPDGAHVVFVGGPSPVSEPGGRNRLWSLSLADSVVRQLDGTEGATSPFFAADSVQVMFSDSDEGVLKRTSITGGQPTKVQSLTGTGAWGPDDTVLVAQDSPGNQLRRFTLGGDVVDVFPAENDRLYVFPALLPGGREFLYTTRWHLAAPIRRLTESSSAPSIRVSPHESSRAPSQ